MFERRSEKVIPRKEFARRLVGAFLITLGIVAGSLLGGTCGYHWLAGFDWETAFHHACLILAGHDTEMGFMSTGAAPVFNGLFVLYARLVFVSLVAIILAPLLHRILHRLQLEGEDF